jgi:hypothetical protein
VGALAAATVKTIDWWARFEPPAGGVVTIGRFAAVQVVHVAEPGNAYEPDGHAEHTDDPDVGALVFAGQGVHAADPITPANVPTGQAVHDAAPPVENFPSSQGRHMNEAIVAANEPAAHGEHEPAPSAENVPVPHGEQFVAPLTPEK